MCFPASAAAIAQNPELYYIEQLPPIPHMESLGLVFQPKIAAETVTLIKQMAKDNRLWGAERIRGELLKLGLRVCKRTIQKYMRTVRTQQPRGQKWSTFLRNHAAQVWACDVRRFGAYEILPGRG